MEEMDEGKGCRVTDLTLCLPALTIVHLACRLPAPRGSAGMRAQRGMMHAY